MYCEESDHLAQLTLGTNEVVISWPYLRSALLCPAVETSPDRSLEPANDFAYDYISVPRCGCTLVGSPLTIHRDNR